MQTYKHIGITVHQTTHPHLFFLFSLKSLKPVSITHDLYRNHRLLSQSPGVKTTIEVCVKWTKKKDHLVMWLFNHDTIKCWLWALGPHLMILNSVICFLMFVYPLVGVDEYGKVFKSILNYSWRYSMHLQPCHDYMKWQLCTFLFTRWKQYRLCFVAGNNCDSDYFTR